MDFLYSQLFITPPLPTTPLPHQTHIITGSNTGLGLAAATHIARLRPSKLILAVRNISAGEAARLKILESLDNNTTTSTTTTNPPPTIEVWHLDMSSFPSVLTFTDRCATDLPRLDAVSLNAGIQTGTFTTMEGYESTLTVNVLSTFLLFFALLPVLQRSADRHNIRPRLSIVSSETHGWAPFSEKNTPVGESVLAAMSHPDKDGVSVGRMVAYPNSKLLEVMIFRHVHPLLKAAGYESVVMNILNPGLCYSDIGRGEPWGLRVFKFFMMGILARRVDVGGRTLVSAVMEDEGGLADGKYLSDGVVSEGLVSGYVKSQEGVEMAGRLWGEVREVLEGVREGVTCGV